MAAPTLTIDINARLAKLEQGIGQANRSIFKFSKDVEDYGKFAEKALAAVGVGFSVGEIVDGLRKIRDMALDEQRSLSQLNAVLKATGSAAGFTGTQLGELADDVKNKSIFDDDDVRKAETALLRFRSVQGEVFEQTIRLAPSVASALGTDLPGAAQILGKALTNPATGMKALKDAGLALSDQQKDLAQRFIETGDIASAQKIVLDELTKSVGGTSEADNDGAYGASRRLTKAWDDMLKVMGRKITGDGAVSDHLARSVQALTHDIDYLSDHWQAFIKLVTTGGGAAGMQIVLDKQIADMVQAAKDKAASVDDGSPGADQAALLGKVNARVQELQNKAYHDNKLALKKRADLAASSFSGELGAQKNALDTEQANLEFSYSQGLISTKTYYDEQERIAAQGALNLQVNLGKQALAQQAIIDAKIGDSGKSLFSDEERAAALQKIAALSDATGKAGFAREQKFAGLEKQRALAVRNLTDEYASLNAQIAESEGDTASAAANTFDKANRERINQLRSEQKDAAGKGLTVNVGAASRALAQLDILRQQSIAQASLNDVTRDYGHLVETIGITQDAVEVAQQGGYITEIDALNKRADLAHQYIPLLNDQIEKYKAIAADTDLPRVLRDDALVNVQKMTLEVSRLSLETDGLSRKFNDIGSGAFSTFLTDLIGHTKSARQALQDMFKSIEQSISKIASDNISQSLFGKDGPLGGFGDVLGGLFGGKSGGASGAAGSAAATAGVASLGTAASATTLAITTTNASLLTLSAAATSAATALLSSSASSGASGLGSLFSGVSNNALGGDYGAFLANGTDNWRGGVATVGERGIEKVYLPKGSRVVPNNKLAGDGAKSRNIVTQHVTQIFNLPAGTSGTTATQLAGTVKDKLASVQRRGFS